MGSANGLSRTDGQVTSPIGGLGSIGSNTGTVSVPEQTLGKIGSAIPKSTVEVLPTPTTQPMGTKDPVITNSVPPMDSSTAKAYLDMLIRDDQRPPENPLNYFRNPTYHWRLFMTPDVDILATLATPPTSVKDMFKVLYGSPNGLVVNRNTGATSTGMPQITIAESGVTGFNIKDVSIEAVVAPTPSSKGANSTKITMTIVEPLGTSFMDLLLKTALDLNIKNYQKCWYYLELRFEGYDDAGLPLTNILEKSKDFNNQNGGLWVWQTKIIDIDTKLDVGGAEYVLQLIPFNEVAVQEDKIHRITTDLTVSGLTLGEFLDDLKYRMNKQVFDDYNSFQVYSYSFELKDIETSTKKYTSSDIRNFKLQKDAKNNPIRNVKFDDSPASLDLTASLERGISLSDIITSLFAQCPETQKMCIGADPGSTQDSKIMASIVPRVEPRIKITGYDPISNNYVLDITYCIFGYETQRPVISTEQADNAAANDAIHNDMLTYTISKGLLKKRYDYIFTGKNTEILRFDIKFNMAWNVVMPQLDGNQRTSTQLPQNSQLYQLQQAQNDTSLIASNKDKIESLQKEISDLKTKMATETSEKAKHPYVNQINDKEQRLAILTQQNTLSTQQVSEVRTSQQQTLKQEQDATLNRKDKIKYTEDLFNVSTEKYKHKSTISFNRGFDDHKHFVGNGFIGQEGKNMSVFGGIVNQLYAPANGVLTVIDMEIRGDPFWLGSGNLERYAEMFQSSDYKADKMKTNIGDNQLILKFKYPLKYGDDGMPLLTKNETFDGVYAVTHVTSHFSNGQFKQTLKANRVPLIEIYRALNGNTSQDSIGNTPSTSNRETPATIPPPVSSTPSSNVSPTALPTATIPNPVSGDVTQLTKLFESKNNPGAIGHDSTGGYSYGTYQITSGGNSPSMPAYLNYLQNSSNPDYNSQYNTLSAAGGASAAQAGDPSFKAAWQNLASNDPTFAQSQQDYNTKANYDPAVASLNAAGFDINNRSTAVQNIVYANATQMGPGLATKAFKNATAGQDVSSMSDADLITAVQGEVGKVDTYFKSSTPAVKASVANRAINQQNAALAMLPPP